mmetsp:Transcript_38604/g.91501  ORF Transcript_38604/g.91501 Transcript_38604/m.91501 type:complete len:212 (-) Transcript_38604:62-697(-)
MAFAARFSLAPNCIASSTSACSSCRPDRISFKCPSRVNRKLSSRLMVAAVARSPQSNNSSLRSLDQNCADRSEICALRSVASAYFSEVGKANPCLRSIMTEDCIMTDRVLGWVFRGREAVEGHLYDFHDNCSTHEFSHLDVLTNSESRTICAHWALTVIPRAKGELVKPGPCKLSGVHIFALNSDNKICDIVTYRTRSVSDENFGYKGSDL